MCESAQQVVLFLLLCRLTFFGAQSRARELAYSGDCCSRAHTSLSRALQNLLESLAQTAVFFRELCPCRLGGELFAIVSHN